MSEKIVKNTDSFSKPNFRASNSKAAYSLTDCLALFMTDASQKMHEKCMPRLT